MIRATAPLVLAGAALLAACSPREPEPAAPAPPNPPPTPQTLPLPTPPLGRAELLDAVRAAASAAATGEAYPTATAELGGRRFALRLPVGCGGPDPKAAVGYAYDAQAGTLRVSARPQDWTRLAQGRLFGQAEAVEGFWLRRPWLLSEACPVGAQGAGPPPAPETVGLVQVFEEGSSRLTRRAGRAYEAVRKLDAQAVPAPGALRLVFEGRIAEAEGRPVRCIALNPEARPVCIVRVELDRVAFEGAAGDMLAEWRS